MTSITQDREMICEGCCDSPGDPRMIGDSIIWACNDCWDEFQSNPCRQCHEPTVEVRTYPDGYRVAICTECTAWTQLV